MLYQVEDVAELIDKLRKRREELGLSQSDLAKLCDLSLNGISKFESNRGSREVKLSTLYKLSKVLGFRLALEFEE